MPVDSLCTRLRYFPVTAAAPVTGATGTTLNAMNNLGNQSKDLLFRKSPSLGYNGFVVVRSRMWGPFGVRDVWWRTSRGSQVQYVQNQVMFLHFLHKYTIFTCT